MTDDFLQMVSGLWAKGSHTRSPASSPHCGFPKLLSERLQHCSVPATKVVVLVGCKCLFLVWENVTHSSKAMILKKGNVNVFCVKQRMVTFANMSEMMGAFLVGTWWEVKG